MARSNSRDLICHSAGRVTATLLLSFFALSARVAKAATSPPLGQQHIVLPPLDPPQTEQRVDLELRQIFHHGTRRHPGLHRKLDVPLGASVWLQEEDSLDRVPLTQVRVDSIPMNIQRLADRSPATLNALQVAGQARGEPVALPPSAWTVDEVKGPNYTDRETVLSFLRMASNAYVLEPNTGDWQDVGGGFNYTDDFGWEDDGLRGHIFADTKNRTVVIGLKGTSPAVFDGEGTTHRDKVNDNLFFSCCCGVGGSASWLRVCDCGTATYTCNSTCLATNLREKDHYYEASKNLYSNVTALYPDADIWLSGHSLGGAVCSFLGLTYGLPLMTFGAPGDAMPAARLGLPVPKNFHIGSDGRQATTGGYHFGHTADPIYMGSCNGWSSTCSIAGYAMESVCHTGMECSYDVVKDKGWRNNMLNHRIMVTRNLFESYDKLPECAPVQDCLDCYLWKYFESNSSQTTTSAPTTTSSTTRTRTATCQTPGWWGCLDETTTTTGTSPTTSTSTTTTSTCKTPGWFGCKDPTTTTATTETTDTTSTPSCKLGWFGCRETTTIPSSFTVTSSRMATPAPSITASTPTASASSSTCRFPGLFWGCDDLSGPSPTRSLRTPIKTATTTTSSASSASCSHPGLFWGCWDPWNAATTPGPVRNDRFREHGL